MQINTDANVRGGPPDAPRAWVIARRSVECVAGALLIVLAARFAWFSLHTLFGDIDDEGYVMISIAGFRRGQALYDEVYTLFGPFYYLVASLLLHLPGAELDHASVRLVVEIVWVATALLGAHIVWRLTRMATLAAVVFSACVLQLSLLVFEPGHAQGLCMLLLAGLPLAGPSRAESVGSLRAVVLGLLCAALFMTKTNVGALATLGVTVALLGSGPVSASRLFVRRALAMGGACLPAILMHGQLDEPFTRLYFAVSTIAIGSVALVSWPSSDEPGSGAKLHAFFGAFLAGSIACVLFVLLEKSSMAGLVEALVRRPARMLGGLPSAPELSVATLASSSISAALCIAWFALQSVRSSARIAPVRVIRGEIVADTKLALGDELAQGDKLALGDELALGDKLALLVKLAFGVGTLVLVLDRHVIGVLGYAAPFTWVSLVPLPDTIRVDRRASMHARASLTWIAVLQTLQAHPVPGSQVAWAGWLVIPAAVLCIGDVIAVLRHRFGPLAAESWSLRAVTSVAGLALLSGSIAAVQRNLFWMESVYDHVVPLDLPGTDGMRALENQVAVYRWATANALDAEVFYSLPGLNSIYFWAGREPPTTINVATRVDLLSKDEQQAVIDALERHPHFLLLLGPAGVRLLDDDAQLRAMPLLAYVKSQTVVAGRVGGFEMRARPGWTPALVACAQRSGESWSFVRSHRVSTKIKRVEVADLRSHSILASTVERTGERTGERAGERHLDLADASGTRVDLGPGGAALDGESGHRIQLVFASKAAEQEVIRSKFAVVRLFDATGALVDLLPFVR